MKITIQSGINIWRIAGRTVPVDGVGIFQGRLLSEVRMTKQLARVGNTPITLPINIRNNDAYIASNIDLWGADVTVVSDSGYTWRGKITAYDSDGGGIMYITATEKSAPELLVKFPDEVARLVTLDENFHVSAINVTLPMVIGGTVEKPILVKGILIDKTAGIYLLCVGDNHQIPSVYRGTELLTAGFVAYTGTAAQENYPGFAYVQLTDESLRKNDDGTYVEVSADVVGLKLGDHTIEECRNGARFLLWLDKTAREGVGGWGLGIAESDIDLDAFNTAITRVDAAGLKMDGIFYFRQIAQSWIDQICHAIRGSYSIGDNGKRRLFVNASAASRKTYTKKNIKLLRYGKGAYTGQVYNKGKIEFGFNPLVGQFTQTAQYEDATSIGAIDEQEFTGQSYLVREMATGKALIDYTCKKSLIGATKVYFETKELPDDCHEGDIITVDYPEKGISGTWQINILDIGDRKHRIEAEKFSDTIFVSGDPGTAIDWTADAPVVSPVTPGAATGLDLSTEIARLPDGTNTIAILGTFTPPDGVTMTASAEYGEGVTPATWINHGLIRGNSFRIAPVKHAQIYSVRVQMLTSTGRSNYVTATITTAGDTEAPAAPVVSVSGVLQFMQVLITLDDPPNDLAGFIVYRGLDDNPLNAEPVGSVTNEVGLARLIDRVNSYTDIYYYFAQAYDEWKNLSDYSAASAPVQAFKILDADILRQLTPADALNTDPYFSDFSAWSSDLAGSAANPDNFVEITGGLAGKTCFKSQVGEKLIFGVNHDRLIPYDITRQYVLTAFMKAIGGGSHGLGFAFYNADKELIGQSDSLQYAVAVTSTWQQFSKAITSAPEGTMFLSPMIVCNNGTAAEVSLELQKCRLREVLTADIFIANEAIITNAIQIAVGIINSAHIIELDAGKIKSGTVDTERLAADIATLRQLAVLGKNLIEDPSFLDLADDFEPTGSDDEYTFGRWTIGADADIPENTTIGSATYLATATHEGQPTSVPVGKGIVITPFAATNRIWLAQRVVVAPSTVYAFSAHVFKGWAENAVCPPFQMVIEWYGSAGKISQTAGYKDDAAGGRFEVSGTAPSTATHAILYLIFPPGEPSSPAFYMCAVSALQFERSEEGATFWVGREQGTIIADRIFTGILKSLNYGALEGSKFDLFAGTFELGGSADPALSWNGLLLKIKGWIEALAGIIAGFTIAEDSLTAGSGASAVGMSTDADKAAFWAGAEDPADAPYRVNHDGTGKIGLLSFTDSVIEHRTYDLNYDPVDPDHTVQTFAIRPNADGWKGAEMIFQDAYAEVGLYVDATSLIYSIWGSPLVKFLPTGARTQAAPQLKIAGGNSSDYAIVTPSIIEGYISNLSDKNIKKDFASVNTLDKLRQLDVSEWSYDDEAIERKAREKEIEESLKAGNKINVRKIPDFFIDKGHRHIGPTAKEFNELFGVFGGNPDAIGVGDETGVALRAIQELASIVETQATVINKQSADIAELRAFIKELKK